MGMNFLIGNRLESWVSKFLSLFISWRSQPLFPHLLTWFTHLSVFKNIFLQWYFSLFPNKDFFFFGFFLRFILFVEETEWQRWGCQKKHFASAGSLPRSLSVHDWLGRGQEPGTPRSLSEWQEPQYLDHLLCSPKAPQQEAVLSDK